jgi:hypothetical protein
VTGAPTATARALLGCAAVVAAAQLAQAQSPMPHEAVEVRVGCVLASNSGQEFDERLVALRPRFNRLFRYTSYSLVKEKKERVVVGSKMGFDVPGGRYLLIIPKELRKDGSVSVKVMLLDGSRPIVDTAVSLHNRGTFLVAGPQYNEGSLILSIGARTAE